MPSGLPSSAGPETLQAGPATSLVQACAVLLGTNLGVLLLYIVVVLLRLRFASGAWKSQKRAGLMMLAFAVDGIA